MNNEEYGTSKTFVSTLSLFMSAGTLVCCALPALFVTLGAGAVLAGIVSSAPWLIALSEYKVWTFSISGATILVSGFMILRSENISCPVDPAQAAACTNLKKTTKWIYWSSVSLWCVGFFFAFLAARIFY